MGRSIGPRGGYGRAAGSAGLTAEVAGGAAGDGAIAAFTGLVRDHNQGRQVRFLEYEAYEPLALRALSRIVDEARATWPGARVGVHHRTGRLEIGEASIIIVAASPHRGGRVRRVPVRDRARQADRADLEARAFRGRRSVARRRHRRPGRRGREAAGTEDRMRVTVRLFARLRDLAGAGELVRDVPAPATVQTVWQALVGGDAGAGRIRAHDVGGGQRGVRPDGGRRARRG